MTKEDFIIKSNIIHNSKYNYSKLNNNINVNDLVIIICNKHGEFKQRGNSHLSGSNCKKCFSENRNPTVDEFIDKCKLVHNNKYDYSNIKSISLKKKILILCTSHGEFTQLAYKHINGQGCKKCANDKNKLSINNFIERSNIVHDNKYDYSSSKYVNQQTKLDIVCSIHGIFSQTPNNHLIHKKGCPKCNGGIKYSSSEFIEKAISKHGDIFQYEVENYVDTSTKIKIKCQNGHIFNQRPTAHLKGQGCPKCRDIKNSYSITEFIEKSNIVHDNKYSYIEYERSNKKIHIFCKKCNNFFLQKPSLHLSGNGCPQCCSNSVSKIEIKWLDYLNIDIKCRHKTINIDNKNYYVDALVNNVIYEFYGDYWHGNINIYNKEDVNKHNKLSFGILYQKTVDRENILKDSGYQIISIWESDFKKLINKI